MKNIYWVANYKDGSTLKQFEGDIENKYQDINRNALVRFDIISNNKPIYSVYIRDGQQLIYRRRTLIKIGSEKEKRAIIYLVGWQSRVMTLSGPKNITVINYIHEDGSISLDGPRKNLQLLDFEK